MNQHVAVGNRRHMTTRARWYLAIAGTRHLLVAFFAIFFAAAFESPSFRPMIQAAPLWLWGMVFAGAGVACAAGACTKRAGVARLGLMLSASSTLMVGAGLLVSLFTGDLSSPTGPIIWLAVAFKDFAVNADPLRSPFEDWAEEMVDEIDRRDS